MQIAGEKLDHFHAFKEYFQPLQLKGTYKKAIFGAIKVVLFAILTACIRTCLYFQEAAKRCKVTFLSSPDDKKLRWIVSGDSPLPKLVIEHDSNENSPIPTILEVDNTIPAPDDETDQKTSPPTVSTGSSSSKGKSRGRGKRGRAKGEKIGIRLTSFEQEMIEWAYGGFLPGGKESLRPTKEEKETHIQVVPVESKSNEEKNQDDMSKKKRKVMMLQVRSKGNCEKYIYSISSIVYKFGLSSFWLNVYD